MPHPVKGIGWLALRTESLMRRTALPLRLAGIAAVLCIVGGSAVLAWLLVTGATLLHPAIGAAAGIYLSYSAFATRDLGDHARAVLRALQSGDTALARQKVSFMVGRDTAAMTLEDVAQAATESVAENTVDGVTAPLFYALLFGPVGAIAYKAVNTLDSTFGYKNERYLEFGWAAAKLDDLANYLPARLTVLVIALAAAIRKLRFIDIFRSVREGARLHASPNAGYPEAAFAGALGVTFGGRRSYGGSIEDAPLLGVKNEPCRPETLQESIILMQLTSATFAVTGIVLCLILGYF
jgi:adenosylcobinamide-phosphate synthase